MAWRRVVQLLIGNDPTDPSSVVDLTGLDFEGKVTRANVMDANQAELTIYNAARSTRNQIEVEGRAVIIKAGYEDEGSGIIFIGVVSEAWSQHVGPDYITHLSATCQRRYDFGFGTTPVALSFAPGTRLDQVIDSVALILGIGFEGRANANDIVLANGFVHVGTAGEVLRKIDRCLRSNGCGMHQDLAALVVYKAGSAIGEYDYLTLTFDNGLLSAEPVKDDVKEQRLLARSKEAQAKARKRLNDAKTTKRRAAASQTLTVQERREAELQRTKAKCRCLLDHRARPNMLARISHPRVVGDYVIDEVVFEFDNMGNKFEMELAVSR